jgi:hypothetical protein
MTKPSRLASKAGALAVASVFLSAANAQGQPVGNPLNLNTPPGVIRAPLPKIEKIITTTGAECGAGPSTIFSGSNIVFAAGGLGYLQAGEALGVADLFGGATGLLLQGSGMADVSSAVVILSDGRRITPRTFNKTCRDGSRTAIRLTFDLPSVSARSTARLQVMAPEPPPLLVSPPPPTQVCTDPVTGTVKSCPVLPPAPRKIVTIADIGLVLHPRPSVAKVEPAEVRSVGGSEVCQGRARISGQNLSNATLTTDDSGRSAGFTSTTISRTATTILADFRKPCRTNVAATSTYITVGAMLRRGVAGDLVLVPKCDTCANPPSNSFGAGYIKFFGPGI